jgi:hypothetical protein
MELDLFLLGHHGGGKEEKILIGRLTDWCPGAGFLPRVQHTATELVDVIFGQQGDPSSTSGSEALRFFCWCSTLSEGQVVRPQSPGGCHFSLEKSIRACCSLSSAETLGARQRVVAKAPRPLIAFPLLYPRCFL